ncbi:BCCT family transporter [Desulfotalea psychrophila]|uniref:Probable glycine-betaine transporter (BetL) n=1 Tax=Desulfotalea psychrophila (strain LSv54 / DSM 12343) TaxID=177439 RepID=Q6ANF3_DESPS|nr:BCCT family transporter [Desulfotalea psychrophila]CAG36121.1 probable glycine-betaine transporter (BetL) [Desulfotalea psychrophila LSv54]
MSKQKNNLMTRLLGQYDPFLFYTTALVTLAIVVFGAIYPEILGKYAMAGRAYIADTFGWLYVSIMALCIIVGFGVAISKYGNLTLGQAGDEPEFSTTTWIAMLFSCGIGVGYVLWGAAEPMFHFMNTPYGAVAGSPEALPVAIRIASFHWGIHCWMGYSIVGLCIAFPAFRQNRPMTLSVALHGLLGDKASTSVWGRLLDTIGAIATVGGLSTALGLGIISLSYGAGLIFGIEVGVGGKLLIMAIIIGLYVISAITGLHRGMAFLSNVNIILAISWCLFILIFGETNTLLRLLVNNVGSYVSEFIPMTFYTDPLQQHSKWFSSWTLFCWLLTIAWAPFVGGFIARISRGRTIRGFIVGAVLAPTAFSLVWFTIVGGSSILAEMNQTAPMWTSISADVGSGIYMLLSTLPFAKLLSIIVFINMILFLVTSADSASFFVAMLMSKGAYEPKTLMKVVWGAFLGTLAVVLLVSGGLGALKSACIIAGAPFGIGMIFMLWSLLKDLKSEMQHSEMEKRQSEIEQIEMLKSEILKSQLQKEAL